MQAPVAVNPMDGPTSGGEDSPLGLRRLRRVGPSQAPGLPQCREGGGQFLGPAAPSPEPLDNLAQRHTPPPRSLKISLGGGVEGVAKYGRFDPLTGPGPPPAEGEYDTTLPGVCLMSDPPFPSRSLSSPFPGSGRRPLKVSNLPLAACLCAVAATVATGARGLFEEKVRPPPPEGGFQPAAWKPSGSPRTQTPTSGAHILMAQLPLDFFPSGDPFFGVKGAYNLFELQA